MAKRGIKVKIKHIFIYIFLISSIFISFFIGFYWNTGRFLLFGVPTTIFACLSHNDFDDAYQMDCFLPIYKKPFTFKKNLDCTAYTNQQFNSSKWRENDPERDNMTFMKSPYVKIKLEFKDKQIIRSSIIDQRKVIYNVVNETKDIIQGLYIPPVQEYNTFDEAHFITISKYHGKGMEVWHNREIENQSGIGSYFFQCE